MNLNEFQQLISTSTKPLVIDIWAKWCVPCRVTKPILEKIASEYAENVDFVAINADESPDVVKHLGVLGIPTVLHFEAGAEMGRIIGAQTEAQYRTMFEALATGDEVNIPIAPFDRLLRIGAGSLLMFVGVMTNTIVLAIVGALLAFWGMADRCSLWQSMKSKIKPTR